MRRKTHTLNIAQNDMITAFAKKHIPAQEAGVSFQPDEIVLGLPMWHLLGVTIGVSTKIFQHQPRITAAEFEEKALTGIKTIATLGAQLERDKQKEGYETTFSGPVTAFRLFEAARHISSSFEDALKNTKLNARFIPIWMRATAERIGTHRVGHAIFPHKDVPIGITLNTRAGNRIATVGGFLAYDKGRLTIHLTNIQGKGNMPIIQISPDARRARAYRHRQRYKKLNELLGENWRVYFVKKVKAFATRKGIKLVGHPPIRFFTATGPIVDDTEYKRQQRQYKQTYRKAGLKPGKKGIWRHTSRTRKIRKATTK